MEDIVLRTLTLLIIGWLLTYAVSFICAKLQVKFTSKNKLWKQDLVKSLSTPLRTLIWFTILVVIADLIISAVFAEPLFDISLLLHMAVAITLGWILLLWLSIWVEQRRASIDESSSTITPTQLDLISKVFTVSIIGLTGLLLLEATGMNIRTLITFGGVGALALAFASQQVISNLFGGMMIYLTQPFSIGEWVSLPEQKVEGHIESIGWYMTQIRGLDKRPIYVPNSVFSQTYVVTPSRMTHQRIKDIISIRHEDLPLIPAIVKDIQKHLDSNPKIDHTQKTLAYLQSINNSSLDIEIQAYVPFVYYPQFETIKHALLLEIAGIIRHHGADFAQQLYFPPPSK